jgi:signal transduction histidine kinase
VALDNADAYRQLKETQAQLAAHEKLASLGSLVAGVAHELNTPIGNSLLMASALQDKTGTLAARFARNDLKKSDLAGWIAAAREASALIVRSLHAAADLVNSFKQVAVDQAGTQRRRFGLAQACHEIVATMMSGVRRAGHALEVRIAPGIKMDSYPGPFGQVLINFVNNALLHAFDGPGGTMVLTAARVDGERVRIEFRDDGRGIAQEHLARIFDPFFTTRMGQGGRGHGVHGGFADKGGNDAGCGGAGMTGNAAVPSASNRRRIKPRRSSARRRPMPRCYRPAYPPASASPR